jgi:hypothetical protein
MHEGVGGRVCWSGALFWGRCRMMCSVASWSRMRTKANVNLFESIYESSCPLFFLGHHSIQHTETLSLSYLFTLPNAHGLTVSILHTWESALQDYDITPSKEILDAENSWGSLRCWAYRYVRSLVKKMMLAGWLFFYQGVT